LEESVASEYEPEFGIKDGDLVISNIKPGFMNKKENRQYLNIYTKGLNFAVDDGQEVCLSEENSYLN